MSVKIEDIMTHLTPDQTEAEQSLSPDTRQTWTAPVINFLMKEMAHVESSIGTTTDGFYGASS